jgi:hypothetical protein
MESYPAYALYPHRIAERAGVVAILGHTTGSHLGLPYNRQQFRLEGET